MKRFHLNQALVINLVSLINNLVLSRILVFIPIVGWIVSLVVSIAIFVLWILGLVAAIKEEEKEVPVVGQIKILK